MLEGAGDGAPREMIAAAASIGGRSTELGLQFVPARPAPVSFSRSGRFSSSAHAGNHDFWSSSADLVEPLAWVWRKYEFGRTLRQDVVVSGWFDHHPLFFEMNRKVLAFGVALATMARTNRESDS